MKISTALYALAAAMFVTAFTLDVEERRKAEARKWEEAANDAVRS